MPPSSAAASGDEAKSKAWSPRPMKGSMCLGGAGLLPTFALVSLLGLSPTAASSHLVNFLQIQKDCSKRLPRFKSTYHL